MLYLTNNTRQHHTTIVTMER